MVSIIFFLPYDDALIGFLNLYIYDFCQIWKLFSHYFLEYPSPTTLLCILQSLQLYVVGSVSSRFLRLPLTFI
jgi:hypothetical protein